MPRPTREELNALAKADQKVIADLVLALWDLIENLDARITEPGRNNRTSSKPSPTDKANFTNLKSLRGKSTRKSGGQKGHSGTILQKGPHPDFIPVEVMGVKLA